MKIFEEWIDSFGRTWSIHHRSLCKGKYCPFHNPSNHPLKNAPINIRSDKMYLVERICEHGIGHDDPDSVAYLHSIGEKWAGVHGCDGCCEVSHMSENEKERYWCPNCGYIIDDGKCNCEEGGQSALKVPCNYQ